MCRTDRHKTLCRMLVFLVEAGRGWPFDRPRLFKEKRHQNTRRSRVTALADLEPSTRVEVGARVMSGVGLVWADVQG